MDEWKEITSGQAFITDLRRDQVIVVGEEEQLLGRYAVWLPVPGECRHQVVEVGTQIQELMQKYNILPEQVFTVSG